MEERVEQVADGFQVAGPFGDPSLEGAVGACQVFGHPVKGHAQGADFVGLEYTSLSNGQIAGGDGR